MDEDRQLVADIGTTCSKLSGLIAAARGKGMMVDVHVDTVEVKVISDSEPMLITSVSARIYRELKL